MFDLNARTCLLASLLDLCILVDDEFKQVASDLDSLEGYAVAIRYPGVTVPAEMGESAFDAVERIRKFIRGKLGLG